MTMPFTTKSELSVAFGAMTFGRAGTEQARITELEDCAEVLNVFQKFGHDEVDTARIYCDGSSEEYLGRLNLPARGIKIDTKLSPIKRFGALAAGFKIRTYTHDPEELQAAVLESLEALKVEKVSLWYLHAPDRAVSYESTLREVNSLYNKGYFTRFGLSNYPAWEVAQICEICIQNGWKKPDVYQGAYNAFQRNIEPELLPCLRKYGIAFYAYNPLAGGFLTDRYLREEKASTEQDGRFNPHSTQGASYRERYWNDAMFDALEAIRLLAKELGMTTAEAALRWMNHHSSMKKEHGDTIVIGASSAKQLESNLMSLEKGPLPRELVDAFEEGWKLTRGTAKLYFF